MEHDLTLSKTRDSTKMKEILVLQTEIGQFQEDQLQERRQVELLIKKIHHELELSQQ